MIKTSLTPELKCESYQQSLRFYTKILGFKVLYKREDEGFAMLAYQGSRIMIDSLQYCSRFVTAEMKKPYGRGVSFQIKSANIDELYHKVKSENWDIFLDMEERWYRADDVELGNKQFLVQDPDGYLLRFFEDLGERGIKQ